jgi:ribosomal protein S18 acetylase RimI-like enzyme
MTISLQLAEDTDLPAIVDLMNAAFRGRLAEKSWSFGTAYVTGTRTNESLLREEIAGGALILLAKEDASLALQGCVSLRRLSAERWYLGSLTVDPALQNKGFGRTLLYRAEEYAVAHGARTMEITVVYVRTALISWYERRGYRRTGETRPFPYGDNRFGIPTRDDLKFVVLDKSLRQSTTGPE